jgi:hypothetical protein
VVRNRVEIERILFEEMERTRVLYEKARADFKETVAEIPSYIPQPDGSLRILNAGKSQEQARLAYMTALNEFNGFIVEGIVPVRLKNS